VGSALSVERWIYHGLKCQVISNHSFKTLKTCCRVDFTVYSNLQFAIMYLPVTWDELWNFESSESASCN